MKGPNLTHGISTKEKIGYAMGDVASNFYWRVFDVFLFIFYTDVFGLPATTVGTMMLVTRLIDAFSDPLMGAIADRTNSKIGKFRPYLLWGIIPMAAAGVLAFTVPDTSESGKLIWAYCTYILMMLAYTFINIPYGALMGVITSDSKERTTLTSFRFIGAFSGGSLVAYFTPELVHAFGRGNEVLGWQLTMALYGIIAGGLFIVSFVTTKERIQPPKKQTSSVKQDLLDLLNNKPWLILFSLALIIMLTITLRGSSGTFYFKYVVGREDLIGLFSMVYLLALTAGAMATPLLVRYVDKKFLLLWLMAAVTVLSVIFYFVPPEQIEVIFAIQILIGICMGPKSPIAFSMYADTADYGEYKNNRRATGMTFAAAAFAQKLGSAFAGGAMGWLLGSMGYVANQTQTDSSNTGIILLMTLLPGLFAFLSVLIILRYPLGRDQVEEMQVELSRRRVQQQVDKTLLNRDEQANG